MKVKLGATKDGKLTAGKAFIAFDAGGFPGGVIGPGCMCVFSCYDLEHARVDGFDVLTNRPKTQAYRAPGSTHAAFAVETIVDEICAELDLDPIDFRIANAAPWLRVRTRASRRGGAGGEFDSPPSAATTSAVGRRARW